MSNAVSTQDSSLRRLAELPGRRYILVGGKGGVGKTSTSAAIAIKFADEGLRTLVLSTDPAHSLGDALMTDLSSGKVTPVAEQGGNLYALEVDLEEAIAEFKRVLGGLGGGSEDSLAGRLGLGEMSSLFDSPPPGADELVALSKIISLVEEGAAKTAMGESLAFDRVVIDTAPTGHTLRLLEYPRFISTLLNRGLSLREKIDVPFDAVGQAGSFLAGQLGIKMPARADVEEAGRRVRDEAARFRDRMQAFDALLHDSDRAEFVVVSIATALSTAETGRLVPQLLDSGVGVRHIVVNQLLQAEGDSDAFLRRIFREQQRTLGFLRSSPHTGGLSQTEVPRFDTEVVGVYGLRALSSIAYRDVSTYGDLFSAPSAAGKRFVFVGGKGGVGKTSMSGALGVRLADDGIKTLIVSTDPAHSLGDALGVPLSGDPAEVLGTNGMLYAMEVDTEQALEDFQEKLRGLTRLGSRFGDLAGRIGLDDLGDMLERPPPGVDELVALTRVLSLAKEADFQRVIIDTAPTGHTLRLLSLPDFVEGFLSKLLSLKRRLDGALSVAKNLFPGLKGFVSGDSSRDDLEDAAVAIERFRASASELHAMLADPSTTQFVVVTAPTALAALESERLVQGLKERDVAVRSLIINQVAAEDNAAGYVQRLAQGQQKCLKELEKLSVTCPLRSKELEAPPIQIKQVPFFDTELRSVYALRTLAAVLFSD